MVQEKNKMRTSVEMYPIVERWQRSGQGKERFAKEHGIPYGTFQYWCSHYHNGNGSKTVTAREPVSLPAHAPAFVPLQVQEDQAVSATSVVIVLPSGTRIEVR